LTGATVLAIQRGEQSVLVPSGHERLQAGDVLAIAGTHDAVEAAKELLAARAADVEQKSMAATDEHGGG
jgi:CPA2 family monovalent cation:H+ antiporter-2